MPKERSHRMYLDDGKSVMPGTSRRRMLTLALSMALIPAAIAGRAAAQDTKVIRIGSGPTGGTDFLFGGLVANAISNPPGSRECDRGGNCGVPGLIAVAQTTAGAVSNLQAVDHGDLEMGLSQADVVTWAYSATGAFSGRAPLSHLRVIAHLYPANIHLVTRAGSTIAGVTDLRGKKVGVGERESATAATAKLVLSAYGVHWDTVRLRYLSFTAFADALATGQIDAMFVIGGAPVLALEDLARRTPIRVVPISGPVAAKLADVLPFYSLGVVPAGTYGAAADVPTLDVGSVLVARDTMDDDLAYGIARAIWHERNIALFQNGHPSGKLMDRTQATTGVGVPVHPGAARFYLAQGSDTPAGSQPSFFRGVTLGAKS
ncbi:MAG: TAXI family TRAP transporter solute-binding subunit [Rhodospirillaceae bacterium]|nr:MAG: TAXI family TRAP transporter solute-binding subunit [Rhodospirillaceae bacterium]